MIENQKKSINLISILLICLILSFILINIYIKDNFDFKLAEMYFFLTINKFKEISLNFTKPQVNAYLLMALTLDVLWPITYSLFYYFLNNKTKNNKTINFLIILLFLSDLVENYLNVKYLYTNKPFYIFPAVIATNIKWLLFAIISVFSIIFTLNYIKKHSIKKLFYN